MIDAIPSIGKNIIPKYTAAVLVHFSDLLKSYFKQAKNKTNPTAALNNHPKQSESFAFKGRFSPVSIVSSTVVVPGAGSCFDSFWPG